MDGMILWSAYPADAHQAVIPPAAINSLFPLFLDNAHSVAMVRHSMDIVRAAVQNVNPGQIPDQEFEEWCIQRAKTTVHFDYWLKTLSLELLMLRYIRSLREGNFQLYVESLTQIMPWMFSLDHTHYSRWLSVHIRDMITLAKKHPDVLAEFMSGNFVVHKTCNQFSGMALDQCHEQNNAKVKGSGGAIGLTGNPGALRRWMIAGPEIARITSEFEQQTVKQQHGASGTGQHHHDHKPGVQAAFLKEVKSLVNVLGEMGNPFLEHSQDLLVIDTRDIMDPQVAEIVRRIETLGEEQYTKFVTERLEKSVRHWSHKQFRRTNCHCSVGHHIKLSPNRRHNLQL